MTDSPQPLLVVFANGTMHACLEEADLTLCGRDWEEGNDPLPAVDMYGKSYNRTCGHCKGIWDRKYDAYRKMEPDQ